ncbi:MAG TPA: YceI family protein [Kofleriaceae bacterium]|nr:YceI family protein [Kofleriaceae bacterium]
MKNLLVIALLSTTTALVGCKKDKAPENKPAAADPAKTDKPADKPADKTAEPAKAAEGAFPAGKYDIDAGHSVFLFKARHFGAGYTYGWFKDVSGSVVVDGDVTKQSIELTIKTDSVDSRDAKRDEHLRSPDFFNAAQFPTITFKSTKIEAGTGGALAVTGDLTMHGVTKPVTAQVVALGTGTDPWKNVRVGYETKLTVKRSDFDMKFMPDGIGDDIELTIGIEGAKK